jgi:tetratricopeptide (TPR) repeat protein
MYLRTSKYKLQRKKPHRFNLLLIFVLCALIVAATYVQGYIVPILTPPFVPTATPTRPASSYAEDADRMFQEGKLSSAVELYKQAILLAPKNTDLYVALSRIQIFAHDYEEAVNNAEYAVLLSKSAISYAVWGEALHRLETAKDLPAYENAIKHLRHSLDLDPSLALAHAYYAEVLMDSDATANWEPASSEARTAIALAPDLMESHRAMGYVYYLTGNYLYALDEYQKAIDLHDKLEDLWIPLGDCYRESYDNIKAIDAYVTASTLATDDPIPMARISRTYAREGQFGKASQYAEMAMTLDPLEPLYRGLLGVMYYHNRNYQEAVTQLTLAVTGGRVEEGVIVGLQIAPWPVSEYYWTYGLALAKVGRCSEAIPVFRLILQELSGDTDAMSQASDGLALCGESTPTLKR